MKVQRMEKTKADGDNMMEKSKGKPGQKGAKPTKRKTKDEEDYRPPPNKASKPNAALATTTRSSARKANQNNNSNEVSRTAN